ncbi:MAG: DUF3857 domain-containing protein [Bacteroidales bacterium]|nr:DUF3857 domain-containing protein [Bacteroidales bacterium]
MKFVLFIFLFINTFFSYSQIKIKDLEAYRSKYKHNDAVVLKQNIDVKYFYDTDKNLKIATTKSENILYLTDNASYLSEELIYHNGLSSVSNISANHYSFDGKKYIKTEVKEFLTEDRFSPSIFFDDNKITRVLYPKLKLFDQTEYEYTEINIEPFLSDIYYFTSYFPIENMELKVTVPKMVNIDYKTFNINSENIKFSKEETSDFIVYKWQAFGLQEYKISEQSVPISYYKPHIAVYINQYDKGGKSQKVSADVASLYNWYYSLIKDVNSENSVQLAKLADSLTKNKTNRIEKIKSIYYWIQDNIKYIAIEDGYSGFIPSKAEEVLQKKYGDCKGMSVLLYSLLKNAQIKSYLTWVGTRDIPYSYSELPTPNVDNHMIVVVENNDSLFFFLIVHQNSIHINIRPTLFKIKMHFLV